MDKIDILIDEVNANIRGIDYVAKTDNERAYGGIIRSAKGKMIEDVCKTLLRIAWEELGGTAERISFPSDRVAIPLKKEYINRIKSQEVRQWISDNYSDFVFNAQVDIHTFIDNKFVLGVECKAYTENAMLKRILVDFTLLKTQFTDLQCALLQLESQLTGDYSQINKPVIYGSHSTHTLMSYFDIDLNILTMIEGERKVDEPIHKPEYFKPLERQSVIRIINIFKELLKPFV